tara:strand:- start:2135 stop:2785 length:651 start_codon:yes stop_codon:yes gene_type:complete
MKKPNLMIYVTKSSFKKMQNSNQELEWSQKLSLIRSREYLFSRGHARYFISTIKNISPLEVPLFSPPGKPPTLKNNFGFLSISHCKSGCLIGWSKFPLGVDIENINRDFLAKEILNKYYSIEERSLLNKYDLNKLKKIVLDYWLIKEASFKLRGGNLLSELKNLIVNQNNKTVLNKELLLTNRYLIKSFKDWRIAVSFDMNINITEPLICYSNFES